VVFGWKKLIGSQNCILKLATDEHCQQTAAHFLLCTRW